MKFFILYRVVIILLVICKRQYQCGLLHNGHHLLPRTRAVELIPGKVFIVPWFRPIPDPGSVGII
jgi:hypothetical protein